MSAIIVIIPALSAAWPAIAAAGAAAAAALGFAMARTRKEVEQANEVEVPLDQTHPAAAELGVAQEMVFSKEGVQITLFRDAGGRVAIRACGKGKTDAELEAMAKQLADGLAQQYAYNRVVTELKGRNFNVVGEETDADGTVRLHVRVFQG